MNKMRVYFETNCKRRQCALVYWKESNICWLV